MANEKVSPTAVTTDDLKAAIKATVEEVLPAAIAAAKAVGAPVAAKTAPNPADTLRCPDCRQLSKACGGKHRQAVVYLHNAPDMMQYWRGVGVNGVWYRSNHPNHLITIPEGVDAESQAHNWGRMEMENRLGRSRAWDQGNVESPRQVPVTDNNSMARV